MSRPVLLTAAEVFCPVGLNVVQAATSVLAGISRVEASSLMDDSVEPIDMGLVPEDVMTPIKESIQAEPHMTAHSVRLLKLLSPCLENLTQRGLSLDEMPMLLAMPGPHDRRHGSFFDGFFAHLENQSEVAFSVSKSRLFPSGRGGFFEALQEGIALIEANAFEHVLIGGVDTLLDPMDISRYLQENRILRANTMDGFTPGEGAAVVVVSHPNAPKKSNESPLAEILGVGLGEEEGHRYSEKPYRGDGLAQAFSELVDAVDAPPEQVKTVFAGFNGENFNAKEWSVAYLRHKTRFIDDVAVEHPAEYFGDARAALPAIMTAVSAFGIHHDMWEGPLLVWASSDDAPRGALLMTGAMP
jgi:3-oxoacyl-[acyl-carrier-protein] synthase I